MFNAFLHSIYSQTHLNLIDDILWACTKCEVKKKTRVINFFYAFIVIQCRGVASNMVLIILMHRLSMLIKYFIPHFILRWDVKRKSFHSLEVACVSYTINMIFSMRLNRFDILFLLWVLFSFIQKTEVCRKCSIQYFNIIAKA